MSKKLAIKGHPTRSKEVIELLKMMGGKDSNDLKCSNTNRFYHVFNEHVCWGYIGPEEIEKYEIFTLEEFFEKYPFKVGDKILDIWGTSCTVKSMSWDENYKTVMYGFEESIFIARGDELKSADDMCNIPSISECKKTGQGTYTIKIADGYKFDSIDENGNIIVKSINPKYPKTYDECCDMLNADEFVGYELMVNFPKLINARNAYWKIAGEQMELGKPWEPDWSNDDETKFCIYTTQNIISLDIFGVDNRILAFPTEEMRDAFYENFKKEIEQCKELL